MPAENESLETLALTYERPKLHSKQRAFIDDPARYTVVEAAPKTGKTVGMMLWLMEQAMRGKDGYNYLWVGPILAQSDIAFRRMKLWLRNSGLPVETYAFSESRRAIRFMPTGTTIWFKGGDKPDTIYGEDYHAAVVDEATRCKDAVWVAVRSTLTATGGPAKIIGNMRGRKNWAYRMARLAQAGEPGYAYYGITGLDAVAAGLYSMAELEDAKRSMPESEFNQLFLLIPADDAGNPFGFEFINLCCVDHLDVGPATACGVDLAKKVDWTVISGFNDANRLCLLERFREDWNQTMIRVNDKIGHAYTAIDSTGVGDKFVEDIQRGRSDEKILGYHYTSASKQVLMEALALAMQRREIQIYEGENKWLRSELESFEYQYTRTGVRYAPLEGMSDDGVNSIALANWIRKNRVATSIEFGKIIETVGTVDRFANGNGHHEDGDEDAGESFFDQMRRY